MADRSAAALAGEVISALLENHGPDAAMTAWEAIALVGADFSRDQMGIEHLLIEHGLLVLEWSSRWGEWALEWAFEPPRGPRRPVVDGWHPDDPAPEEVSDASDVASVLLVPYADPRSRLTRGGPCGYRPPVAHQRPRPPGSVGPVEWAADEKGMFLPHALVLQWQGEILMAGCHHAEPGGGGIGLHDAIEEGRWDDLRRYAANKSARLVLLDAEGREVNDGE